MPHPSSSTLLEDERAPVFQRRFSGELSHDATNGVIFHCCRLKLIHEMYVKRHDT
jgi:hypothetical protein